MRILIAAVGRARRDPAAGLFAQYCKRLTWKVELREVEEKKPLAAAKLKAREAELLLAAIPGRAVVVALDAGGRTLDSAGFARQLDDWQNRGRSSIAFLIGGAEGLDQAVLERADLVLSLGPMTWPHLMVRGMLAEQLFRAQSILAGHPYHRG